MWKDVVVEVPERGKAAGFGRFSQGRGRLGFGKLLPIINILSSFFILFKT
jgi:hypothetical protein